MPSLPNLWNIDWLNANSQRKYPLRDDATSLDSTGTVTLPSDFIVDLSLPVHADASIDPTLFHIQEVAVFGNGLTITLGYNETPIGSTVIDLATFTTGSVYPVQCSGDFFDSVGQITIWSITKLLATPGVFTFNVAGAGLLPRVIVPDMRGVSALYIKNGDSVSEAISGDVVLEARKNFAISLVTRSGTAVDPHVITFSAVEGEGLNSDCECSEALQKPCIKTIDGIGPNAQGEFTLYESACIKLEAVANGLILKDDCAKPCCGCAELDVVKSTLDRIIQQVNGLDTFARNLRTEVNVMSTNIAASGIRLVGLNE